MKSLGRGAGVVLNSVFLSYLRCCALRCFPLSRMWMLFFCDRAGYEIHADGTTRSMAAAKAIEAGSSGDLANLATAKAPRYKGSQKLSRPCDVREPRRQRRHLDDLTVAIHRLGSGKDHVILQLTWGQNAINLAEVGKRGSLFIPGVSVDGRAMLPHSPESRQH